MTKVSRRQFLTASALAGVAALLPRQAQAATRRWLQCPILMYHYMSQPPVDADRYRIDLSVTPGNFAKQLDWLLENGYTPITLADHHKALFDDDNTLPDKPVVLTFDDGYADAYENAFPLLAEREIPGTFFLISSLVESTGYLTWQQAAEMLAAGMEIGSHTSTHPDLTTLSYREQRAEIEDAAAAIEETLGNFPQFFCYPIGRWSWTTARLVRLAGHLGAVTTRDGTVQTARAPWTMSRVRIRNSTSLASFAWLLDREVW